MGVSTIVDFLPSNLVYDIDNGKNKDKVNLLLAESNQRVSIYGASKTTREKPGNRTS